MPIAAVPNYLGQDFKETSPGMRFGMYLKLWGINQRTNAFLWKIHDVAYEVRGQENKEREVKKENKASSLDAAKIFGERDKHTMKALADRQLSLAQTNPTDALLRLDAVSTAPFTTGLGNEHPLENGFSFLNPYGLPYLPGSGVKGVLRQAARELASGEWGNAHGWNDAPIEILFGRESENGNTDHLRGTLQFWDVIPQIKGDHLMVDIMTPHQSHYYQKGETPHESGQTNPISFLTVPPNSGFTFLVTCDLNRLTPDLAQDGRWKILLEAAFQHAFQWLGFGAKTAVGYGVLASEAMRKARCEAKLQVMEQRKHEQTQTNAEIWEGAKIKYNRRNETLTVEKNGKSAHAIAPKGKELLDSLPADIRKKVETNQFVRVNARVSGGELLDILT
ncbi:type III-B CRISPR module RAMP protein Cmr6 [Ferrovum myxofaciens]|uniref:type III-B CRISPR module RAMP protein Cmr6 n=1 Tax=Ferrovum myxofaciens TaxID=416213 RepID=UPI003EBCDAA9